MENTSSKYDYEGKTREVVTTEEEGGVLGFYLCIGIFILIFFAVILVKVFNL